jgi:hypothetical protein
MRSNFGISWEGKKKTGITFRGKRWKKYGFRSDIETREK